MDIWKRLDLIWHEDIICHFWSSEKWIPEVAESQKKSWKYEHESTEYKLGKGG